MNDDLQKNSSGQRNAAAKNWSTQNEHQKPPMTKAELRATDRSKKQNPAGRTPRPEPNEQDADSLAQQQQRSTGVSGHSGST